MNNYTVATRDAAKKIGSESKLNAFRSAISGKLIAPGEEGFQEATRLWNGMIQKKPALVVQPASTMDVAETVTFARDHGLLLSVRGGGHNIAGTAIAENGLMLDMSRLRSVKVDSEASIVHVGPGCLIGDVDRATQVYGAATVLGFISDTGIAGLTLGGGLGYLTRRFGWTVDNLDSVEIVTADSEIRSASRSENPDLFWAIRGGGGNFGVITRFTYQLHNVGPTIFGGLIAWPFERADDVLQAYKTLTTEACLELTVFLVLLQAPPAPFVPPEWHGKRICAMSICYSGDLDKVPEVLKPVYQIGNPILNLTKAQPYVQLQSYLDATEPEGFHYYWKTEFISELNPDLLSIIRDLFGSCPIPGAQIGFLHLGGALNERPPDDGAIGNRDARFALGVNGMWPPDEPRAEDFTSWIYQAWHRVRPFSTGGNYVNFQTADEDEGRILETYGSNYERLVAIKEKFDPHNLFRSNRNIWSRALNKDGQ